MTNKKIYLFLLMIAVVSVVMLVVIVLNFKKSKNMNDNNVQNKSAVENPLQVFDLVIGASDAVKTGDIVKVHYIGSLQDGSEFDNSYKRGAPLEFQVGGGQLIAGFDKGVLGMKKGGKRKIIIPSQMGYGPDGNPPVIPPNATLIFEVELVEISR